MKLFFYFSLVVLFLACEQQNKVLDVNIIEAKDYDIPAKFEVTYRASITDTSYTEEELRNVVASFYDLASKKKSKFHKAPTHIFIFIYNNTPSPDGANWIAMQSRVAQKENPIQVRIAK